MRWNYQCHEVFRKVIWHPIAGFLEFFAGLSWEYAHYRKGGGFEKINNRPLYTDSFWSAVKRAWDQRHRED